MPRALSALDEAHRALLGEDARALAEFPLSATQAADWTHALQASTERRAARPSLAGAAVPARRLAARAGACPREAARPRAGGAARWRRRPGRARAGADAAPARTGRAVARPRVPGRHHVHRRAAALHRALRRRRSTGRRVSAACCSTSGPRCCRPRARRPASRSTTTGRAASRRRRGCSSCRPTRAARGRGHDLVDAVTETLDLAHLRAVEPDQLDATAVGAPPACDRQRRDAAADHDRRRSRPRQRTAHGGGARWLNASTSPTSAPRSPSGCSRPSPSGTGSRAVRAPPTSRAACAPRCAMRSGCSRASGSSASSRRTTPALPCRRKLHVATSELLGYQAGHGRRPAPFPDGLPLDAVVERREPPFEVGGSPIALDLRLALGRRWLALVAPIGSYADAFRATYGFALPDPDDPADAAICAHPAAWAARRRRRGPRAGRRGPVRPPRGGSREPRLRRRGRNRPERPARARRCRRRVPSPGSPT